MGVKNYLHRVLKILHLSLILQLTVPKNPNAAIEFSDAAIEFSKAAIENPNAAIEFCNCSNRNRLFVQ